MARLRVGIIGAGQLARLHVEAYEKNEDAVVYAVCDRREEVVIKRALDWGATRAYTDYRDLLADPEVDAVEILTPHHLHHEMALEAIAAKKHVHLAKPICISLRGADQILSSAKEQGCRVAGERARSFLPSDNGSQGFLGCR